MGVYDWKREGDDCSLSLFVLVLSLASLFGAVALSASRTISGSGRYLSK